MSNQETAMKLAAQEIRAQWEAAKKKSEDSCPHMAGSNPLSVGGLSDLTGIVWHYFDDNVVRGICTNCLKVFEPGDPDYKFVARRSVNKMSECSTSSEVVPLTDDVKREIAYQFCDFDRDYTPPSELSIKDFIKNELLKDFVDKLYIEYIKNTRS